MDDSGSAAAVAAAHPGWHAWQGIRPHLRYARLMRSSPPAVVRGRTWRELDIRLREYEREHRRG